MAHRKKKKTTTRRRSGHRMSGTGGVMKMLLSVGGGMLAQKALSGIAQKAAPTIFTPMIANLATGAAGMLILPKMIKGPTGMAVGVGMGGMALVNTIASFGILPGILSGTGDSGQVFHVQLPPNTTNGMNVVGAPYNGTSQLSVVGAARRTHPYHTGRR